MEGSGIIWEKLFCNQHPLINQRSTLDFSETFSTDTDSESFNLVFRRTERLYQIIFHWQRWAEERPSEQTAVQTSALAEPATGTADHKHEALTSNGTLPFIAGSELKQIGYQLWCLICSLIMRGYNLQESELIHSSWCNLHLSIGDCLVNHHRMMWILAPIFWTSSQRLGFCMVSVWSLCA